MGVNPVLGTPSYLQVHYMHFLFNIHHLFSFTMLSVIIEALNKLLSFGSLIVVLENERFTCLLKFVKLVWLISYLCRTQIDLLYIHKFIITEFIINITLESI